MWHATSAERAGMPIRVAAGSSNGSKVPRVLVGTEMKGRPNLSSKSARGLLAALLWTPWFRCATAGVAYAPDDHALRLARRARARAHAAAERTGQRWLGCTHCTQGDVEGRRTMPVRVVTVHEVGDVLLVWRCAAAAAAPPPSPHFSASLCGRSPVGSVLYILEYRHGRAARTARARH